MERRTVEAATMGEMLSLCPFSTRTYIHALCTGGAHRCFLVRDQMDRVVGAGDAELMFHDTRGRVARITAYKGETSRDAEAFLASVRAWAVEAGASSVWLTDTTVTFERSTLKRAGYAPSSDGHMILYSWKFGRADIPVEGIQVRPMVAEEYPVVRRRLLPHVSRGTRVATDEQVREALGRGTYRPYVAVRDDGEIVGHAELNEFHAPTRRVDRYLLVERVVVAPEARGKGIAGAIVASMVGSAKKSGHVTVELQVAPDNAAAIRTYESLGFGRTRAELYSLSLS